jgi:hypothetical protein
MFREKLLLRGLSLSGLFFLLFPIARPFFDESTLSGAMQFASGRWVLAHSIGIFGLILMPLGFFGLYLYLRETKAERAAFSAFITNSLGAGLTLPFFGAEAFSLQIIGHAAVTMNNPSLIPLVNQVRFGPGLFFIVTGLVLMSISTIIIARASWISGNMPKWAGIPLATGFVLFLPLLQGNPSFQWMRIGDGLLIAIGCFILTYKSKRPDETN